MQLQVYLSGGMEFAEDNGAEWRSRLEVWLKNKLGHSCFNPVKASEELLSTKYSGADFRDAKSSNFAKHREIAKEIVSLDSTEIILRTDYLVCYYNESAQRGAGTKGELTVAAIFGKPVYLVKDMAIEKIPSWVIGCATEIFDNFESLQDFLLKKYK